MPALYPTAPWARVALSVLVVVHVLAGAANVARDTAPGAAVREWTKPWEKVLGVHQTWPMFAVAPTSTNLLRPRGVPRHGGELVDLPGLLPGEPPMDGVIWVYSRGGKVERNAVAGKRDYLRQSFARYLCAEHPELKAIRFDRWTRRTPPPRFGRSFLPRPEWVIQDTELETIGCRR